MTDLRHALRGLVTSPGFTAAALLSLAIGIGANSALFSVTSALLLRPLPYKNADRLVILWNRSPGLNIAEDWFSTAQYFDIKTGHSGFEQVAIAIGGNFNLTGDGDPERVGVVQVSSNLLPMVGARPALGRLFVAEEDAPGHPRAAVLGYGIWTRRFGNDPGVVGRSLTLNGQPYTIAGVLPQDFSLPREVLPTLGVAEDGEIFLSLPLPATAATDRTREDYNIVGTLKSGVTVPRAQAEMDALTARLRRDFPNEYPPNSGLTFSIVPLLEQVVGNVRRALLILVGSVGFVLLIACANVANLLLSRALAREKEIAVRAALGASRSRIVRQLLTESLLLSLLGGALGVALAYAAVRGIHVLQPPGLPRLRDIAIDARVGLAPAFAAGRLNVYGTLKDAARGSGAGALWGRGNRLRRLLVVSELALAVVLLVGAGLLIRSFARLQDVAPGFNPNGVLTVELTMNGRKYANGPAVVETYRQLWEKLDRLPGVTASGGVTALPLSGYFSWGPITIEGRALPPGERFVNADQRVVSGRYFEAMGIPLRSGRFFSEQDTTDHPRVVIIDEFMAAEMWPGQDPIGRRPVDVTVADRRRRRRARQAVHAGRGRPYRDVLPADAEPVAGDVRDGEDCRSGVARAAGHERDPRARSGFAPLSPRADDDARRRIAGAAAFLDAAAVALRGRGAGARGDRHLRRDGVPRRPEHARDRHQNGAGREPADGPRDDSASGDDGRAGRRGDRSGGRARAVTRDAQPAVRRPGIGSADVRGCVRAARRDRPRRDLPARETSRADRSDDFAEGRVEPRTGTLNPSTARRSRAPSPPPSKKPKTEKRKLKTESFLFSLFCFQFLFHFPRSFLAR